MSEDIQRVIEVLESEEEITPEQKPETVEKLCIMCGSPSEDKHINECTYMACSLSDIFSEELPKPIQELYEITENDHTVSVGALKVILASILARQEKINNIYQMRLAKLGLRAIGPGNESEPNKWSNV